MRCCHSRSVTAVLSEPGRADAVLGIASIERSFVVAFAALAVAGREPRRQITSQDRELGYGVEYCDMQRSVFARRARAVGFLPRLASDDTAPHVERDVAPGLE
jgi:hypothetical protein